jgi:hypothetical protein
MAEPKLVPIRTGWAALGDGWAVHAPSQEEARRRFEEAERRHREIEARPPFYERLRRADSAQL